LKTIKVQLEQLGCPYIENADEQTLAEMLLTPSEQRLRILTWVVSTFDSKLGELVDMSVPVINAGADSRQKKILLALNLMGVCKIDDLELVRGKTSQKKQMKFWSQLIDLLYTSERGRPYAGESSELDGSFYLKPVSDNTVNDLHKNACSFIDTLVRKHKAKDLFSADLKLFSPEMQVTIKEEKKNMQGTLPQVKVLEEKIQNMSSDLEELTKELDDVLYECSSCIKPDHQTVDNYCRKLDLTLKTYSQMVDNLLHCYDSDIKSWCTKRDQAPAMDFGPSLKTVSAMSSDPLNLMKCIASYSETSAYLCNDIKHAGASSVAADDVAADRSVCDILQNTISRKHACGK